MKKNAYIYLFISAILSTLVACEDYVDIDIPGQEKKIVAYCFLSPQDTVLRAFVYQSSPLFDTIHNYNPDYIINNAIVTLDDGFNSIQLPYNEIENKYYIDASAFPITAGTTYNLTVEVAGLKTVTAKTTVPVQTPHFTYANLVQLIDVGANPDEGSNRFLFETKWQDFAGEENFYSLNIFNQIITDWGNMINHDASQVYYDYFNDAGIDGTIISNSAEVYGIFSGFNPEGSEKYFRAYLLNCSEDYYYYQRSIINGGGGGDPFSEPTITYTNIENGLGCFGSFNGSSVAIEY